MKEVFIRDLKIDKDESLYCWIANKRKMKNTLFLDIYDSTGILQAIALKDKCKNYQELTKITRESAICLKGQLKSDGEKIFFAIDDYKILAKSSLTISPYPNENKIDILNAKYARQVVEHPTFYIRNRKLSTIYYIKSKFKREIQNYFDEKGFVEFESPTLTKQTLYDDSGVLWLNVEGQKISLSRCATFHLEPAILAYEKVFTITNSHADEKVKTNRHLVEYLHLKAEMCWVKLEELITFAGNMYYEVAKRTYDKCKNEFHDIVGEVKIKELLEKLNPQNHVLITYDEAVDIIRKQNISFEYGKSLTTHQEEIITFHFNNNFVWVKYVPYKVEGFMFKRKADKHFLTETCDLIAPNGFGEILGCAEKITDYDELINSMKEKEKYKDFNRYKDYALLHKFGLPVHGGIGMGIERAIRYLLNVEHVKYTKPFAVIKNSQINH